MNLINRHQNNFLSSSSKRVRNCIRKASVFLLAIGLLQLMAASSASAANFFLLQSGGVSFNYIYMSGEIELGDTKKFKNFIQRNYGSSKVDRIILNSPGGVLIEGIYLGLYIRELEASTEVGKVDLDSYIDLDNSEIIRGHLAFPAEGSCESACAYAFLGGVFRVATDRQIGLHQFSTDFASVDWIDTDREPRLADIEASTQIAIGLLVQYLHKLGDIDFRVLSIASMTDSSDMYYLPLRNAKELNVVTGDLFDEFFLEPYGSGIIAASRAKDSYTGYDSSREHNSVSQATMFCRNGHPTLMLSSENFPNSLSGEKGKAEVDLFFTDGQKMTLKPPISYRTRNGVLYTEISANELVAHLKFAPVRMEVEFWLPGDWLGRNEFSKDLSEREISFLNAASEFCL